MFDAELFKSQFMGLFVPSADVSGDAVRCTEYRLRQDLRLQTKPDGTSKETIQQDTRLADG